MADNYLEKKMDDLRSGKLNRTVRGANGIQSGTIKGRLHGLTAVVTGGANGIGMEIASTLRKAGANVDIIDCDVKGGYAAAQKHSLKFYPCDISNAAEFERCIKEIIKSRGNIDIMVNNAAIADFIPLQDNSADRMMKSLQTNLLPAFISAQIIFRHRLENSCKSEYGGRIINICSTRALQSEAGTENYSASKGGLLALTHALMMSMKDVGITVNAISPGWIENNPDVRHSFDDEIQHPSNRVGRPSDIARACLYICERGNDFLNGENIIIDGGMTHRMIYVE